MTKTDLIIIGAGPGGYQAAGLAAKAGLKVTLFEEGQVGGTCLNVGCIPTKAFARHAEILISLKEAKLMGLDNLSFDFNYPRVVERKDEVIASLREGVETLLSHPNITVVRARASFKDVNTVTAGGEDYTAGNIIIATGSGSKTLRLDECSGIPVLDSTNLLSATTLPQRLCVIGAGVIGMEFASILNVFGVEVTVVEFLKECLPALDSDIAKRLRKSLEKRGITFHMQSAVKAITNEGVVFENKKGKTEVVATDAVLMAVGRYPNTEGLNLKAAGVEVMRNGAVPVNPATFKVQNTDNIFAIGDVNGLQMLAHAAEMQAQHVVNVLTGKADDINFQIMPAAIFTLPEAACVGLSEDQCKDQGTDYICHKAFWRANGKAQAMNETEGMLKLLTDSEGQIIGCHAFGAHAADLIQEVAALMCRNTNIYQLADIIHIHPTLSEIIKSTAES